MWLSESVKATASQLPAGVLSNEDDSDLAACFQSMYSMRLHDPSCTETFSQPLFYAEEWLEDAQIHAAFNRLLAVKQESHEPQQPGPPHPMPMAEDTSTDTAKESGSHQVALKPLAGLEDTIAQVAQAEARQQHVDSSSQATKASGQHQVAVNPVARLEDTTAQAAKASGQQQVAVEPVARLEDTTVPPEKPAEVCTRPIATPLRAKQEAQEAPEGEPPAKKRKSLTRQDLVTVRREWFSAMANLGSNCILYIHIRRYLYIYMYI